MQSRLIEAPVQAQSSSVQSTSSTAFSFTVQSAQVVGRRAGVRPDDPGVLAVVGLCKDGKGNATCARPATDGRGLRLNRGTPPSYDRIVVLRSVFRSEATVWGTAVFAAAL